MMLLRGSALNLLHVENSNQVDRAVGTWAITLCVRQFKIWNYISHIHKRESEKSITMGALSL